MTINETEKLRNKLQAGCNLLVRRIGKIQIGSPELFPYGWRKAAKGRTVWRIVEEIITQNLEAYHKEFCLDEVHPSDSEVSVYDMECRYADIAAYINIKTAVENGKRRKDDISKARGLRAFYKEDAERQLFVATFFLRFNPDMTIEITDVIVFPVAWIPDVYVNPSNNGNLQSAYYHDLIKAERRTNRQFVSVLDEAFGIAEEKIRNK